MQCCPSSAATSTTTAQPLRAVAGVVDRPLASKFRWALTAALEGFPRRVWPARGGHAEIGVLDPPDAAPPQGPPLSPEFLTSFEAGGGSALVVARGGEIMASHFARRYNPATAFNSFSMVKSLVGFLTIKALSDGAIDSLDATVGRLWPQASRSPVANTTVRELLDMRSGIVFEHSPDDLGRAATPLQRARIYSPFTNLSRLHVVGSDVITSCASAISVVESARGRHLYQNLNTSILGRILEEVHGLPLETLLDREIASPAGAGGFRWRCHPMTGRVTAYACLYATPHWWVAVAHHLLHNGHDRPLLSPPWHDYFLGTDLADHEVRAGRYRGQVRHNMVESDGGLRSNRVLCFYGRGGQVVAIIPSEDLIVVRLGRRDLRPHDTILPQLLGRPDPGLTPRAAPTGAVALQGGPTR